MSFNLKKIKTASTFELPIKDTDGNPTGVTFTLAGPTHPVRKAQQMAKNRQLIQQANKNGRVMLPDPQDTEAIKPKDLAQLTLGWAGYVDDNGQPVAYSPAAAEALYADPDMLWLVEQVEEGLGNKQLFTKVAAPS